jgi:hypothetical protein
VLVAGSHRKTLASFGDCFRFPRLTAPFSYKYQGLGGTTKSKHVTSVAEYYRAVGSLSPPQ